MHHEHAWTFEQKFYEQSVIDFTIYRVAIEDLSSRMLDNCQHLCTFIWVVVAKSSLFFVVFGKTAKEVVIWWIFH